MKVRSKYLLVIHPFKMNVTIGYVGGRYEKIISRNTCGLPIYECSFNQVIYNLKILTKEGYILHKKKY